MLCVGNNPNPDLFICQNGGWIPKDNPNVIQTQPPPVVTNDFQPPYSDEYEEVDTYPGFGPKTRVRVRTSNPNDWFVDGKTYRHPYGFIIKVDGIALKNFEGTWRWSHRLVITESAGDPEVGHVLYARLFASRENWEEVR